MIKANNPDLNTWIEVGPNSDFPIQNLPFGIFKTDDRDPRVGVAIGNMILDLAAAADNGLISHPAVPPNIFNDRYLNGFMALGRGVCRDIRNRISDLLEANNAELRDNAELCGRVLVQMSDAKMLLPIDIRDYTDFYSSIEHATNVGTMFRGPENALMPNWKHLPVGYHGRASSIVVSGTPIHRPKGQTMPQDAEKPVFGPSKLMDFELEMAFITCKATRLGQSVSTKEAENFIWGLALFNDWSARDIQKWEYVPLGPFLGKNFGSTLSPWIVTMDALEAVRVAGPEQDPPVLPYLQYDGARNYDINLEVYIQPENQEPHRVCQSNFKYMYWNMSQQLAHHTVNGCNINVGDVYASGTISGPTEDSRGSMLEISWRGSQPVKMPDGTERKFINDNDTVILRGFGLNNGIRIGFGEASGKILPAK